MTLLNDTRDIVRNDLAKSLKQKVEEKELMDLAAIDKFNFFYPSGVRMQTWRITRNGSVFIENPILTLRRPPS
jgi:hypothetical protein